MKNLVIIFLLAVVYFQYSLSKESKEAVSSAFTGEPESGSAEDDSVVKKCMDDVDLAAGPPARAAPRAVAGSPSTTPVSVMSPVFVITYDHVTVEPTNTDGPGATKRLTR